jgi:hypothetical protein
MKADDTDVAPVLDLRAPYGVVPQAESGTITAVLLTDTAGWIKVKPGSFHYYITGDPQKGERAVPYLEFYGWIAVDGLSGWRKVQCFPAAMAAYIVADEDDD